MDPFKLPAKGIYPLRIFQIANDRFVDWAMERVRLQFHPEPCVRVALYPRGENSPYLTVLKHELELARAEVIWLDKLDIPTLTRLRLQCEVLHIHQIKEYENPFTGEGSREQVVNASREIATIWAAKRLGYRIFWTMVNEPDRELLGEWIAHHGRLALFHMADKIFCQTHDSTRWLRNAFSEVEAEKVEFFPTHAFHSFYPATLTRAQALKKLGIEPRGKVFLVYGNVQPYRGLTDIISLFGRGRLSRHTLIVGGQPVHKHYAKTIEGICERFPNVCARIKPIDRNEVQQYFQAADFCAYPYRQMSHSGWMMLALTFGRPVIVPDSPLTREVLDNGACIRYDIHEEKGLARALLSVLDKDDSAMKRAALINGERFRARKIVRQLVNRYISFFPGREPVLIDEDEEI